MIQLIFMTGIRTSVENGNISYYDLTTVLPFDDEIQLITVTGEEILEALEHSVAR